MQNKPSGKKLVNVWLQPAAIEIIDSIAREHETTRAAVIKEALAAQIPELKRLFANKKIFSKE